MAFRLYLVPSVGTGLFPDAVRAKYFRDQGLPSVGMNYGFQPAWLVGADLSAADDTAMIANADVFAFPFDLIARLSAGQANTASAALETLLIPAHWITASLTWRDVARTTAGMFQFMQRAHSIIGNQPLLDGTGNRTLNTQFQQLSRTTQQGILRTAWSFGYDVDFIAPNTQWRAVLKNFADQWGGRPFRFGGPWGVVEI